MLEFVKHFQSLEKGKLYLLSETPEMELETFLLFLTALMDEDQSVTWVDYKYKIEPIEFYYNNLNLVEAKKPEIDKQFDAMKELMGLEFYAKREKEIVFLNEEPFYAPYCFDQLIKKFKLRPTKFMIINNLNSFFGERELYDPEERNWVIRQFKRLAVECNCILLLSYTFEGFFFDLEQLPFKLKEYNWSRNMVSEMDDIYFFLRYDIYTVKYEKDLAKVFSIKQRAMWSGEIRKFSPDDLFKPIFD